jgi:hypothetical protein
MFIVGLLVAGNSIGQVNKLAKVPAQAAANREPDIESRNHNCSKQASKSFSTRLKNYPFYLTAEVQVVSFKGGFDTLLNEIVEKTGRLPRENDTICYSKLYEIKTLTLAQIDNLTDIFYNYGFLGSFHIMSINECYDPRNAIIFVDKNGKAFEFIEICFECRRIEVSSDKISLGQMCDQKLDMIKDIFKNAGVEYGITKGLILNN